MIEDVQYKEKSLEKIPKEWKVVQLIDTVEKDNDIIAGPFGSNLKVSDYRNEGIPIIRLQNIERNQFINKDIKYISPAKAKELNYHSFKSGDVVLAKLGDPIGKTCIVPDFLKEGIVVADVVRIRVSSDKAVKKFIEYILNSSICGNQLRRETIGSTRPRVNISQIRNLMILLPPLPEQEKIVEILYSIDNAIQKSNELITKTEKLKKGLMQDLFENAQWRFESLSNEKIFKLIMGQSPPSSTYNFNKEGLPFYQGNADFGELNPNPRIYCNSPLKIADKGDILISVRAPVGELNIVDKKCCIGRGLAAIRIIAGDNLFYYYFLKYIKNRVQAFSQGSTFKAITATEFKKINVPIPDIKEQQKIAEILSVVDKKLIIERKRKQKLETIKKGLMNDLLTGKKRVRGFKNA